MEDMPREVKYIIVTGGVLSGLGKGITTSSIGLLLKMHGYNLTAIKIDPYLNCDAGTMNPFQHGEVFVLEDGGEVDLDLRRLGGRLSFRGQGFGRRLPFDDRIAFGHVEAEQAGIKALVPLEVIPNHIGINLCSVEAISWQKQEDGQLANVFIHFSPA